MHVTARIRHRRTGRFRTGIFFAAIAATFASGAAHAVDDRWYLAPMGSYSLADDDRHRKDGIGARLALGTRLSGTTEIELIGDTLKFGKKDGNKGYKQGTAGVGVNFFMLSEGTGPYLHFDIMAAVDDADPVIDVGAGMYLFVSKGFAIRAEALYHNYDVNRFREPLFNVGVRIPLGAAPADPVLPPRQPEQVAVVAPAAPPPVCSNGMDDDGDGKVDFPADPGCAAADDGDETDPAPPPPACPPPAPGEPVTLEGCKAGDVIVLRGVNFDFDKSTLTVNAKTILDEVSAALLSRPDIKFELGGHTDGKGSDAYNLKLSDRRAHSVESYLAKKGVAKDRMSAQGYGESMPVADNETDEGRELNRRVELKITESGGGVAVAPPVPAPADAVPAPAPAMEAAAPAPAAAASGPVTVTIANFAFSPAALTVAPGTTVVWTNGDGSPHSVKFADGDSGKFGQGGVYRKTFDAPGSYPYECGIHGTMKGTITVQ